MPMITRNGCRFILALLVTATAAGDATAVEHPTTRPYDGLAWRLEVRDDPPQRLCVAEIDLTHPRVRLRVAPGGPDPDGPGEWETTLMRPTQVAERERFELAVNGDFFEIRRGAAPDTRPGYRSAVWAAAIGPAVTDGQVWSVAGRPLPCLIVYRDHRVDFKYITRPPDDALAVIAGNRMLVEDGKPILTRFEARHPRTVLGLDARRRKLTILVIDGRKPGVAVGMSYAEISEEMIRRGCADALNLDGGGSSVMVLRDPESGNLQILNSPSDGRERPVANVLGVDIVEEE